MPEVTTDWSKALATDRRIGDTGESNYTAKVTILSTGIELDGYVDTGTNRPPVLTLPFGSNWIQYTSEDVHKLEHDLKQEYGVSKKWAIEAGMGRRNRQLLGIDFAARDVDPQLPLPLRQPINGFELTGYPPLITLRGDGAKFWEKSLKGLDLETVEEYAKRVNTRFGVLRFEPVEFEAWKNLATESFNAVRLF